MSVENSTRVKGSAGRYHGRRSPRQPLRHDCDAYPHPTGGRPIGQARLCDYDRNATRGEKCHCDGQIMRIRLLSIH